MKNKDSISIQCLHCLQLIVIHIDNVGYFSDLAYKSGKYKMERVISNSRLYLL